MSELWRRLGFVALALLVYRIGTHIPIPGINPEQVAALVLLKPVAALEPVLV